MKNNRPFRVLDDVAGDYIPDTLNLMPHIAVKLERKSFMLTLRSRPLAAIVLALLILLILSGVAYALGRSLGYIPGLGVVDQNTQFHILAEPVSQTRDEVTITVESAIMNADSVLITFKVEGLSADKFSPLEPLNTCFDVEELRFPGGDSLKPSGGTYKPLNGAAVFDTTSNNSGFENSSKYGPIPTGANEATLFIPCINGSLTPGALPENWEIPLHFVPAPPDMALTMLPVIEIAPSMDAQNVTTAPNVESTSSVPDAGVANPVILTQVIDAGDTYILVGEDHLPAPSQPGDVQLVDWVLTDGNDQSLDYQVPSADMDFGGKTMLTDKNLWVVQVAKGFTPPIHITHRYRYVVPADSPDTYIFEFDAGANPQQDQVWNVNQEFQLAGHTVRLDTITAVNLPVPFDGSPGIYAYWFNLQTDDSAVNSFTVNIDGHIPNVGDPRNNHANNYAEGDPWAGKFFNYVTFPQMPTGKLKVIFSNLYLNGELKSWTVDWQP